MHASATSPLYVCPNCAHSVKVDATECEECRADFSSPGGWKPLKNGAAPEVEPSAFFLCCFFAGVTFLTYLTSLAVLGTWDVMRGSRALGTSLLWAYFRFSLAELLPFAVVGVAASVVLLRGARLPRDKWATTVFGWATAFFSMFLAAMLLLGIMAVVVAPFFLVPAVLLYVIGTVIVATRLAKRRANLSLKSRPPTAAA